MDVVNDFVYQFIMTQMNKDGVIPFIWSGGTFYQRVRAYESIWANYEGYDDYMLNYSLSGTDKQLGNITPDNFGVLSEQEGIKAAIYAAKSIIDGKHFDPRSFNTQYTEAQTLYISSIEDAEAGGKQIAMFMEGGYWEVEAIDTFNRMNNNPDWAFGKRNFKRFPIPNFTGESATKAGVTAQTNVKDKEVLIGHSAYKNVALIAEKNASDNPAVQNKLARLFLQFVNSREQLVKFTANTGGCIGSYKFTPNEEEMATFTKFGQNIFEYINNGSKVAIDVPLHSFRRANLDEYEYAGYFLVNETINGRVINVYEPLAFFNSESGKNVSVDQCWKYMQTQYKKLAAKYAG